MSRVNTAVMSLTCAPYLVSLETLVEAELVFLSGRRSKHANFLVDISQVGNFKRLCFTLNTLCTTGTKKAFSGVNDMAGITVHDKFSLFGEALLAKIDFSPRLLFGCQRIIQVSVWVGRVSICSAYCVN